MAFIKISNPADHINRLYLEKLGVSTKRDNEETIGQFGSGSKFAPIAALRKGIRWVSVGEDEDGPYQLEFVVKPEDGFNNIYALYDDCDLKPTSFTLEAGMLSWEDDFQIFREAFANALDEFRLSGKMYSVDIVDEIKFESGIFSVYLSATDEMLKIVDNLDYYFHNREVIAEIPYGYSGHVGKILDHGDYDDSLFYCKGVLVHEGKHSDWSNALFSYDFSGLVLNEERRVRYDTNLYEVVWSNIFSKLKADNPVHVDIAHKLITSDGKDFFELNVGKDWITSYMWDSNSAFVKAWVDYYGDDACAFYPVGPNVKEIPPLIRAHNLKPISVHSEILYQVLTWCGVKVAETVLNDEIKYDFITLSGEDQEMWDRCLSIVDKYDPRITICVDEFRFFEPIGDHQESILGVATDSKIYISIRAFRDDVTLLGTIVHELDHILENWNAHDAAFRGFADNRIGSLLVLLNKVMGEGNEWTL